jgi:hypothetical protein
MNKKEFKEIVDKMLVLYSDYKVLHEMFGDTYYKDIMELTLGQLGRLVESYKEQLV